MLSTSSSSSKEVATLSMLAASQLPISTIQTPASHLKLVLNPLPHGDANRHTIFKRKN